MASITDLILSQVKNVAGNVDVPSNVQNTVLQGLSDSILGSLTQTATKPGGIDMIKSLLTGKTNAAASPITALAGKIFSGNILSKLNLGNAKNLALIALIPTVLSKISGIIKDQDGDGDVDLNDILITLKGGNKTQTASAGSSILGAATSILGGILGRKK
ncbi:MAG: hypothetical protein IKH49_07855 [Bacteroidales bacterium]|nr:hypothetical protein [Bacteroidales bacterium]